MIIKEILNKLKREKSFKGALSLSLDFLMEYKAVENRLISYSEDAPTGFSYLAKKGLDSYHREFLETLKILLVDEKKEEVGEAADLKS
jgi:hypothetical protein